MSDVSRKELQWTIDGICKYLKKNRNYIAQELYKEMHRDDFLGNYGHIYAYNDTYNIEITLRRKKEDK